MYERDNFPDSEMDKLREKNEALCHSLTLVRDLLIGQKSATAVLSLWAICDDGLMSVLDIEPDDNQ